VAASENRAAKGIPERNARESLVLLDGYDYQEMIFFAQ
jgi:hypothetical protein